MKLARYHSDGATKYGVLVEENIVSLPDLARKQRVKLPNDLPGVIAMGANSLGIARSLLADCTERDLEACSKPLSEVHLLAPVPWPPKIICLGKNYRDHVEETSAETPDEPVIFMKPRTTIIGPGDSIVKPSFVRELDYEAELAIVMGERGKRLSIDEAPAHIFGFTILNDVTARDIQSRDKQWTRAKSFDTFAPTGPCVATTDDLKDTSNLSIRTWVNSELRQNSYTAMMIFSVEQILYHLSRVMTLEPCDIIATGTPAGVGFKMKPKPKFLHAGDSVKIEIESIGVLENSVIDEEEA